MGSDIRANCDVGAAGAICQRDVSNATRYKENRCWLWLLFGLHDIGVGWVTGPAGRPGGTDRGVAR